MTATVDVAEQEEQRAAFEAALATAPLADDPEATIHQRMARILAELPAIGKDQRNEQQNFMYRGYDDVLNALNPLLAKHGVYLVPDAVERVANADRLTSNGKTMYEVNLHVRFRFFGLKGDYVEASGWGEGTDMADKATSKAMTMALKYVLFQTFAISTEEASDADGQTPEETTRQPAGQPAAPRTPQPADQPRDWAQIKQWVEQGYDRGTWDAFVEFTGDAAEALFKQRTDLSEENKKRLGIITATVVGRLYEVVGPGGALPPTRAEIAGVWKEQLPDVDFKGPEWRMSPDEQDRPVRGEESPFQAPGEPKGAEAPAE